MTAKIQNLNGTHNMIHLSKEVDNVVYDCKDTKFEWNSQLMRRYNVLFIVVYDCKDTKFEWNSQHNGNDPEYARRCL